MKLAMVLGSAILSLMGAAAQSPVAAPDEIVGEGKYRDRDGAEEMARTDLYKKALGIALKQCKRRREDHGLAAAMMESSGEDWLVDLNIKQGEKLDTGMWHFEIGAKIDRAKFDEVWKRRSDFAVKIGKLVVAIDPSVEVSQSRALLSKSLLECGFEVLDQQRFAEIREQESKIQMPEGGDSAHALRAAASLKAHILVKREAKSWTACWVETAKCIVKSRSEDVAKASDEVCMGICMTLRDWCEKGVQVQVVVSKVAADRADEVRRELHKLSKANIFVFGDADIQTVGDRIEVCGYATCSLADLYNRIEGGLPKEFGVRKGDSLFVKLEISLEAR